MPSDADEPPMEGAWARAFYEQERERRRRKNSKVTLSVVAACIVVLSRVMVAPLLLLGVFTLTKYQSGATFLIEAQDSYFAFSHHDAVSAGGCTNCMGTCKEAIFQYNAFNGEALKSKPSYQELANTVSYDFSTLSADALALANRLDASGAICYTGINEWASPNIVVVGSAQDILDVITTLQLSVAPQMVRELEVAAEDNGGCETLWTLEALLRLFRFQTVKNSLEYSSIPAADLNVFPDLTWCRPDIPVESVSGAKLAYATDGEDLLTVVPDLLKLFPYGFTSSLPLISRTIEVPPTSSGATSVTQPLFRGYYGGCRVREVNTTGVYVEDTCTLSDHWSTYGLMLHSPDDIPVCNTGNVCIHNYYNSLWEWVNELDTTMDNRIAMILNVFRSRFGDSVQLSVLPGIVAVQILLMGIITLYQVMSQKRSVLLTQIWAYRCQNGRMQIMYLAQVTYHLIYNSDMYYLGLATGTLTTESQVNLTLCIFIFSYAFVNLVKARSGEQQLDRYFRLVWEGMQILTTASVASILYLVRVKSLTFIMDNNGELLRKTSERGAKYCGLSDSCILFKHNLAIVVVLISLGLGLIAVILTSIVRYFNRGAQPRSADRYRVANPAVKERSASKTRNDGSCFVDGEQQLTSFELHCLGAPFTKLFTDCNDMAYVNFLDKRCSTQEALLLTGYIFYGDHIYQAPSVVLLLLARALPRKLLRTFNQLLIRWHVDPEEGTLTHPLSCTWYTASAENYKLSGSTPVA